MDNMFLTRKRLSELIDVSERTFERWRVEGTGPAFVKAGRKVLYRANDVEAWLLATRRQSTSSSSGNSLSDKNARPEPHVDGVKKDDPITSDDEEVNHDR